ncbi:MAG: type II CAAX prenyl endopeptidase Rce1 family protein [Candidatus Bathyarchaeia archaeon]
MALSLIFHDVTGAFLHLDPWAFFHTFTIGIIFAYAYETTSSLPLVMIAHCLNNTVAFFV